MFEVEEAGYRVLVDTGLTPRQIVDAIAIVNNTIAGVARSAAAEAADQRNQGTDYTTYWAGTTDFWETTFDPSRFPTMTRLWTTGVFDEGTTPFEMRFESLLDTIALLIERAQIDGATQIPSYDDCMSQYGTTATD